MAKEGYYSVEVNQTIYELPFRYESIVLIAYGPYGQLCSAVDNETGMKVAIKKLTNPFSSTVHAKRTYRVIRILKRLKHENIIGLLDLFTPGTSVDSYNDIYLVVPFMIADLNSIMRRQRLSDEHIQLLIYQILRGLKYVHSAGIIHRDLKPSNIAVNEDCDLKIIDFCLAKCAAKTRTVYRATLWYKAPEIMLNWNHYNKTIDIWSVGCIMGELMMGQVLFRGYNHIDQFTRILTLVGSPNEEFLKKIPSYEARSFIETLPIREGPDLYTVFNDANPLAIDLLKKMLDLDPDSRITAEEALAHEYLHSYSDPSDEPTSDPYDESFEDEELGCIDWKKLVWNECHTFDPSSKYNSEIN